VLSLSLAPSECAKGSPPPLLTSGNRVGAPIKRCGVAKEEQRSLGEEGQLDHLASRARRSQSVLLPLLLHQVWHHSQADPTRAALPSGHPVVSSKTPDASAKTRTQRCVVVAACVCRPHQLCVCVLALASGVFDVTTGCPVGKAARVGSA